MANFVGQSNFVTGKVEETGERTTVRTESGRTVFARPCAMAVGEEVVVGVKIGNTDIAREGDSFFEGIIERMLFEGRNLHVDVLVEGIGPLLGQGPQLAPGQADVRGQGHDQMER